MRIVSPSMICLFFFGCSTNIQKNDKTITSNSDKLNKIDSNQLNGEKDNKSFFYDPSISTLEGDIFRIPVFGPNSNENDIIPRDTMIAIVLKRSIAVVNPSGVDTTNFEENDPNEYNVDTIQLAIPSLKSFDKLIGQSVQLKGTLYHADNGNQFTNVLMYVHEVKIGKDSLILKY